MPLTELIATACRVLAATRLAPGILGHISARDKSGRVLVRCRGPLERGLAATTTNDVHAVPARDPAPGTVPDDLAGWRLPSELPIHTAVLRARPDATAVVHAHPAAVVTMSLAGLPWLPIVGAFDIPAARLAADGIPVWPRAALVNTPALGDDLARSLGERSVLVLRGHGLVTIGTGEPEAAVAEAVVRAVAVDQLARMTLAVVAAGAAPEPISDEDLAQLPDLGPALNVATMWRYLVSTLPESPS